MNKLVLRLVLLVYTFLTIMSESKETPETTTKTIFLIRHAESEENRRIASLKTCFRSLGKFSLPSASDVRASTELLNVGGQIDSSVSEIGAKQIQQMGETLKDANFVQSSGIQLVVHSPLERARETSLGMLGCVAPDTKVDPVDRVIELELLKEKTPSEWTPMYWSSFRERITEFERWLGEQPEETIALVGHSQYFKAMLGLDFKFGNCDVWQATFDASKMAKPETAETEVVLPSTIEVDESVAVDDSSSDKGSWDLPPQWTDLKILFEANKKETDQQ